MEITPPIVRRGSVLCSIELLGVAIALPVTAAGTLAGLP